MANERNSKYDYKTESLQYQPVPQPSRPTYARGFWIGLGVAAGSIIVGPLALLAWLAVLIVAIVNLASQPKRRFGRGMLLGLGCGIMVAALLFGLCVAALSRH